MKKCQFCLLSGEDPEEASDADCEYIIELHYADGKKDKRAYAICAACGTQVMDGHDQEERQTGLKNLA